MTIELLGPLRVDGQDVSLGRRDHVVLMALAVRAGEVVPADRLADALWGDSVPPSWQKVVQGCVLRLRRRFGQALIETAPAGYRLAVTEEALDTWLFEELTQRGRLLAAAGEYDRAAVALGRALELWRGRPFDVLDSWSPGQIEATRLEELRRSAEESVLEARLHSGEHREVVPIAEARVSEEPLREHRWALLALALYRCGRQADALRMLKRARSTLVDQLGIEPGAELVSLEAAILRQDATLLAPPASPTISERCPYKGLAPYDVDDTDAFFGRDAEIEACVDRLLANPLLVVTGPSGCGKSSLVRAGVMPALHRTGLGVVLFQPGTDPEAAMAGALATCDGTPALVVDQFEELLAVDDDSGTRLRGFCARLVDYATDIAPVVITIRADHIAALAGHPRFAQLAERGLHLVTALAGDELRQAIEAPAALAGLRLESGLVDLLVHECDGEPGAMPLLSHALAETWQRRDGRVLTVEAYRATGEIRGAVARSADRLYESLPAEQRPKLRSLLLRLVSPSTNGEPVRARLPTRVLGGDADREHLLALLVRARLVTAEEDTVELAHEALARAWPRLRSWLDEDAAGQRILNHLSTAADGWEALGRPATELYRGARLDAVLEWQSTEKPDLTDLEKAFLDSSVADATAERDLHANRARVQARQRRRMHRAVAGVVILLLAAAGGGVAAYQQRQTNQRDRREAAVSALGVRSEALRSSQPDLAALLAVESNRLAPTPASDSVLFGALTGTHGLQRILHTAIEFDAPTTSGAFVPDSETLALVDHRAGVHLIDLTSGQHTQLEALGDDDGRAGLGVSTSGRYLATFWNSAESSALLTVWDLNRGERRFDPVTVPYRVWSVAINDTGSQVAISGGADHRTQVRDGATGLLQLELEPPPPSSDNVSVVIKASVAFAPDGRLVVGSRSGPIRFVDPVTGAELQRIDGPSMTSESALFFNREGTVLVTAGSAGVIAYDIESGAPLSDAPHLAAACNNLVYAELIGATLCADESRLIAHDVDTGETLDSELDAPEGDVCGLTVSADGTTLAAVSSCLDGPATITQWRLDGGGPISRLVLPTRETHWVSWYGLGGNNTSLVAAIGTGEAVETIAVDTSTGEVLDRFAGVWGLLPSDDPTVGVAIFNDETMARYDLARHAPIEIVDPGFEIYDARVSGNSWSAGETVVVYGGGDQLQGIDFTTGDLVEPAIDGSGDFDVRAYDVTDDSVYMIIVPSDDDEARIERRDLDTGELIGDPFVGYHDFVVGDDLLILTTTDGRILEVDPDTSEPIGLPFPAIIGPRDWTLLDPTGDRLLIRGDDMTLRLYDVATRTPLGPPIALEGDPTVSRTQFRRDGLELAADTDDGIITWDLDPAHWADAACQLAGRNLTESEWDQYIGDLAPYRATCPQFATD